MNNSPSKFQGVACCCLNEQRTVKDTINTILNITSTSSHYGVSCYDLNLDNKYYKATVHLFDYDGLSVDKIDDGQILDHCHAIILFGSGKKLTVEQLDKKIEQLHSVGGEPRILLYEDEDDHHQDEKVADDCKTSKMLRDWTIKNGYDFIDHNEEDIKNQLIDSLSAYKWTYRTESNNAKTTTTVTARNVSTLSNVKAPADATTQTSVTSTISEGGVSTSSESTENGKTNHNTNGDHESDEKPQLDGHLMKKLKDFDSLLSKLSAYRDRPELRGAPNDKNIEEIAEILSGLLDGEDVDEFLENEE